MWENDWGFLAGSQDLKKVNATKMYTTDDKIKAVQEELEKLDHINVYNRTSNAYGKGPKIEMFDDKTHNISQNKDLLSCSRKLPKEWKKKKWTPSADEFDPLKKLYTKK